MRLCTMRWLDEVAGGALCRGLARLVGLGLASRPAAPDKTGPALFIGLAEMGSVVLADPAMVRARDIHGADPHFLIFRQNRDCLALTGTVRPENVFCLRTDSLLSLAADVLRFMVWARRRGIATAIDIDPRANFPALLAFLSGAGRRAGFRHAADGEGGRAALYNRGVDYRPDIHLARNLLALADAALEAYPRDTASRLPPLPSIVRREVTPMERLTVLARLLALGGDFDPARHRILLVNPNVGDLLPLRRWPSRNFKALIQAVLARRSDTFVFLLGSDKDAPAVAALEAEVGDRRCRSLAGTFALAELPALFESSAVLLSSDSGPAHFAAVTSLPVVVLFGPESTARYRPLGKATAIAAGLPCSPCLSPGDGRRTACRDNRCMQAISVATVLAEVERRLDAAGAPALPYESALAA
ncbi:MAG TPA: glycosyltransferase family 9 protein [Rhodocyclaceae bacterium]|nr:glycosyltransferase family 9 protein [Rhodocyclaceae bacterium]